MIAAPERLELYPFRRLFARLFDTFVAELLVFWGLALWLGLNASLGLAASVGACVLMLLAETVFLILSVPSPGKWLFSIRVHPVGDSKLGVWRAFDRGFTAFTIGAGCYLPFVGWYAAIQSYRNLTETGQTTWDRGKFTVVHGTLRWRNFLVAGVVVVMMWVLLAITLAVFQKV
jgi:hypothetical protein